MKQFLTLMLILLFGVNLYGEERNSYSHINETIRNTDVVLKKVDNAYRIIENSSTSKSVYSVLKKYGNKNEAILASNWFNMATQLTSNRKMAFFITNSSYKVKALLSRLSLERENRLIPKDRSFLFEKIDYLVDRTAIDRPMTSNAIYKSKIDLFIRSMPIVNRLTKKKHLTKFKILKKGQRFKLLYKLKYKHKKGYPLRWGFIETIKNNQRGWINLNKINIK